MRALRTAVVLVLALVLPGPVLAADFQAGLEAYHRGDYATALKEFRPLAEQGEAEAQHKLGGMYASGRSSGALSSAYTSYSQLGEANGGRVVVK